MTVELLISTMHQKDHSLLDKMKVNSNAVVVNQCDTENEESFLYRGYSIKWINTTERGLSRSRNMAIRHATADICMLADDDMEYRSQYVKTVCAAFAQTKADMIGFQVIGIEKPFKQYSSEEHKVSYMNSMKMASVELAFLRKSILEKKIAFDELIGAGTEFLMGEESALLFQCIRKGLKVHYIPQEIADLHIGQSTWFTKRNAEFFRGKGAAFAAMNVPFTSLLILQFAIRKRLLYCETISFFDAIRQMNIGKKLYLKKKKDFASNNK